MSGETAKQESGWSVERFWSKVDKIDNCWLWIAAVNQGNGYGRYAVNRKGIYAHRFAYIVTKGSIPKGYQIDHLCKVRNCVNPDHLEAVTPMENVRRSVSANRVKTHCKHGHEFTEENTRTYENYRQCRKCHAYRQRERRRRLVYA